MILEMTELEKVALAEALGSYLVEMKYISARTDRHEQKIELWARESALERILARIEAPPG